MSSKTSIRSLLIIPALNEERTLPDVLADVRRTLPDLDVLVIDDGSRDNTAHAARMAGASVVRHPFNLGYGAAIQTGYCLLYTSPSPRDVEESRMPSSA